MGEQLSCGSRRLLGQTLLLCCLSRDLNEGHWPRVLGGHWSHIYITAIFVAWRSGTRLNRLGPISQEHAWDVDDAGKVGVTVRSDAALGYGSATVCQNTRLGLIGGAYTAAYELGGVTLYAASVAVAKLVLEGQGQLQTAFHHASAGVVMDALDFDRRAVRSLKHRQDIRGLAVVKLDLGREDGGEVLWQLRRHVFLAEDQTVWEEVDARDPILIAVLVANRDLRVFTSDQLLRVRLGDHGRFFSAPHRLDLILVHDRGLLAAGVEEGRSLLALEAAHELRRTFAEEEGLLA